MEGLKVRFKKEKEREVIDRKGIHVCMLVGVIVKIKRYVSVLWIKREIE